MKRRQRCCVVACFGDKDGWERIKKEYGELREKSLSAQQKYRRNKGNTKPHLTAKEKEFLSIYCFDGGKKKICSFHFRELTDHDPSCLKNIPRTPHAHIPPRTNPPHHLKLNDDLVYSLREYCLLSDNFQWDPKNGHITFSTDVNSWEAQHKAFCQSQWGKVCPSIGRKTFTKGVRVNIFNFYKITRKPLTSDACDACVLYAKTQKAFLIRLRLEKNFSENLPAFRCFAIEHALWQRHRFLAFQERQHYSLNCHEAQSPNSPWLHLSVDAMQVQHLPTIHTLQAHSLYFLLKEKLYLMGVVNEGTEEGVAFIWDQTEGPTTTNHVLSAIWSYIIAYGGGKRRLRLTMDNCGVNKSYVFAGVFFDIFSIFSSIDIFF